MTTESTLDNDNDAQNGPSTRRRRAAKSQAGPPTAASTNTSDVQLPTLAGGGFRAPEVATGTRAGKNATRPSQAPKTQPPAPTQPLPQRAADNPTPPANPNPPVSAAAPESAPAASAQATGTAASAGRTAAGPNTTTRGVSKPSTGRLFDLPEADDVSADDVADDDAAISAATDTEAVEPDEAAAEQGVAEQSTGDADETDDDQPRRSRRRRRSRGRRGRSAETTTDAAEADDAEASSTEPADDASDTSGAAAGSATTAQATATNASTADADTSDAAAPATVGSSPFLLFQAPDLSAPKPKPEPQPEPADADTSAAEASDAATADADSDSDDDDGSSRRRRRRRGGRGRRKRAEDGAEAAADGEASSEDTTSSSQTVVETQETDDDGSTRRRRRRRRRGGSDDESDAGGVTGVKGSTRLEAKRQRRRDGRDSGRRRHVVTEAEFLARRESVERALVVRETEGRTQVAVLEDDVLVEHYVARKSGRSMIGNVYMGRVQNVLPSMEAAFVDIGKGRNAVLYAGEVNWDAAGLDGSPRRIETALKSGDAVLVQVTKDPIGHKGPRLTSQISLPGRYLVYVPGQSMTGISRKLPDTERSRLKKILKTIVPEDAGVIVRTAAEGASEDELKRDVARLQAQWAKIEKKSKSANPPSLLYQEPDLAVKSIRDVFNEDFKSLTVSGDEAWTTVSNYVSDLAPDLVDRVHRWNPADGDVFEAKRLDEQIMKALDRKVYLPSGGSLVIDRTEAMTVVDVNTGKFTGSGGNLEATVTKNNLEAAEEIVRQLRLRDIGGIIVVDFIDMVLESNRDLVLRRLLECLSRDRTKHQVAEVTSLGLVQMTRKRLGQGLAEGFGETCASCDGQGMVFKDVPGMVTAPEKPVEGKAEQRRAAGAAAVARVAAATKQNATDEDGDEAEPEPAKTSRKRGSGRKRRGSAASRDAAESSPDTPDDLKLTQTAG